jgi:DNA repair protein RadA/Sms
VAKSKTLFSCRGCGALSSKWNGQCEACHEWNTLEEETAEGSSQAVKVQRSGKILDLTDLSHPTPPKDRFHTTFQEVDRTLGGGLVPGSVILIGGDPGIGKSTLVLQISAHLSKAHQAIYISGEEGADQIRLRAKRLGVADQPLKFAASTNLSRILATIKKYPECQVVIIDSIQTMYADVLESAPGTVSQVRFCTHELVTFAKKHNVIIILIGHVTKEGAIAGPRVLEHMVDTVLYFEGERGHHFRILRAVKNRFGPTDEIGVFEMSEKGLQEVKNPSTLFLNEKSHHMSGSAIFAGLEGTRPLLMEIQSLVAGTNFGHPRRTVIGWDGGRLAMITAVLEARAGINFGAKDIYLNIMGGLKIQEPAADLAVAASLISSLYNSALPEHTLFFGEVGLTGEIRPVSQTEKRLKEAKKLGFTQAFVPKSKHIKKEIEGLTVIALSHIKDLVDHLNMSS